LIAKPPDPSNADNKIYLWVIFKESHLLFELVRIQEIITIKKLTVRAARQFEPAIPCMIRPLIWSRFPFNSPLKLLDYVITSIRRPVVDDYHLTSGMSLR
jgi:hypothetical protein